MTISELRDLLKGLPGDSRVTFERIEDVYFRNHGWTTVKVKDEDNNWDDEFVESSLGFYNQDNKILCIKGHI